MSPGKLLSTNAVITGASSGIGRAMSWELARLGLDLFLVARREDKLRALKEELLEAYPKTNIFLLPFDVNDSLLDEELKNLTQKKVGIFINNAGLALGRSKVESSSFEDMSRMIETNLSSAIRLTQLILPWMLAEGGGDIINLCSIAGHFTYQGGAVYCATKSAIHSFTRVLREETCGRNIRVMQISPGMVETEFSLVRFKGNTAEAKSVYENMTPLTAEDIASMMTFMLTRPRHVVIDEIITMPTDQGSPTTVVRKGIN